MSRTIVFGLIVCLLVAVNPSLLESSDNHAKSGHFLCDLDVPDNVAFFSAESQPFVRSV